MKQANGIKEGKLVYAGKEVDFAPAGTLTIGESEVEVHFKSLREKLTNKYTWKGEYENFTFITYVGGKGDNFTDIHKDGKIYISNLGYQSLKRIGEAKGWNTSALHKQYLIAVGRAKTAANKHTTASI